MLINCADAFEFIARSAIMESQADDGLKKKNGALATGDIGIIEIMQNTRVKTIGIFYHHNVLI